jgi:signal transduction histidine kinase
MAGTPSLDDDNGDPRAEIERLRADNARLRELLDMAQDFGRLGVWERDPQSLEGRWDAHVFRYFGFEPGETPRFADAALRVHPDDRIDDRFTASLARPGAHEHRYRIVRPDGSVAHMHSHWRVVPASADRPARVIGVMMDDTQVHELAAGAAAAQAQLSLALSLSGIGLWWHDLATGRIHYDERANAILGRPPSTLGLPLETVRGSIHPDDLPDVRAAFERTLAEGGPVDTQTRYRHADGGWRTVLTRRMLQRDEQGRPTMIVGVGLDVTEQQQRTIASLQLARQLDAAAQAARVGLWSGPLDGRMPQWNARMYALIGHDPAAGPLRLGDSLRRYVHPDDRDRAAARTLAWMHGPVEATLEMELRIVRGDAQVRWVELRCAQEVDPDGLRRAFGVMLDVTEQRTALDALREAHERTTLALSSAGMGTWSYDFARGENEWDPQMNRLRGLDPAGPALDAEERLALVLEEDRAAVTAAREAMLTQPGPLAHEFRIRRADDGRVRTLVSRSVALLDAQGRIARRIGVNWDVTDAREAERAQRDRELALRESRTRSALFSRVSHELRTPLNAVLGFTQLLLAEGERAEPAQRERRLRQIQQAGEALLTLVDGVLDLSEQAGADAAAAQHAPVVLADAVEAALAPLASAIGARGIRIVRGDLSTVVHSDGRRVQQVLAQLLGNAVKFSRPSGAVHVQARRDGAQAVLGVTDSGPGIAPERAARLFEPFADAAGPTPGQGIGLAIAHAMAERLGGRLALARTGPEGSLFELRLPLARGASAPHDAQRTQPAPLAGPVARSTVLYIEDNEVNMLIVRELLRQRPAISFHGASDGASGIGKARELRPALVLVDMQLPDIDGFEVLRRLRAEPATASLTCVALSANAMPEDVARARAAGFDDYWTKPIDLPRFLSALEKLLPAAG